MSIKSRIATAISLHMLAWLAMLIVLVGIVFLASGFYWLLARPLGPAGAAIVIGLALIASVLTAAWWLIVSNREQRHAQQVAERESDNPIEHQLRPLLGDRATRWTKEHSGVALVGALSAGLIVASSPSLRRLVVEAARPLIARKALQMMQNLGGGQ